MVTLKKTLHLKKAFAGLNMTVEDLKAGLLQRSITAFPVNSTLWRFGNMQCCNLMGKII